jgi:hypothetical protein
LATSLFERQEVDLFQYGKERPLQSPDGIILDGDISCSDMMPELILACIADKKTIKVGIA